MHFRYRRKRRESDNLDTTVKEEVPAFAYSVDNNRTHQQETANPDSDLEMTYNAKYAMETSPIFENQINREEVTGSTDQTKEFNNELVLTDNAMYKLDSQNIEYNDTDSVEEGTIQGVKYSIDKRKAFDNDSEMTENTVYRLDIANLEHNHTELVTEGNNQKSEHSSHKDVGAKNEQVMSDNPMYKLDTPNIQCNNINSVIGTNNQHVNNSPDKTAAPDDKSVITDNSMYKLDHPNIINDNIESVTEQRTQYKGKIIFTDKTVAPNDELFMTDNPMYKQDRPPIGDNKYGLVAENSDTCLSKSDIVKDQQERQFQIYHELDYSDMEPVTADLAKCEENDYSYAYSH